MLKVAFFVFLMMGVGSEFREEGRRGLQAFMLKVGGRSLSELLLFKK